MTNWIRYFTIIVLTLLLSACAHENVQQAQHNVNQEKAAKLQVALGMSYMKHGHMDLAKRKFLKALQLDPKLPSAHYSMGYYLETVGNTTAAKRYYQQALTIAPHDPRVLNGYGVFLCKTGNAQEADRYFQKAITEPQYTQVDLAYENAGLCALENQQFEQAKTYLQAALRHNPRLASANLELAKLAFKDKRYSAAQRYWQRYNQLAQPTQASLKLGIRIAEHYGDQQLAATLRLQLHQ